MLNICTVCKEEYDDDSGELSDNDVCPECYKELYYPMVDEPDDEFYDKFKVDFTFEDLHSDLEES